MIQAIREDAKNQLQSGGDLALLLLPFVSACSGAKANVPNVGGIKLFFKMWGGGIFDG